MKLLFVIFFIPFVVPLTAHSQDTSKVVIGLILRANPEAPGMSGKEAINHVGSEVYVRDTVFNYKIINRSLSILYVGDRDIEKALNIIVKGNKAKINAKDWKNVLGHFRGKVVFYKNSPAIIITDWHQLGTEIEI